MTNNTNINDLGNAILQQLQQYGRTVSSEIEIHSKEVAQELMQDLRKESPKLTGDYRKGWKLKKGRNKWIVYNKTNYQLTHLLEHGHAKRGGGRVEAKVHIRPAEEKAIGDFLERIERVIDQ